MLKRGNLQFTNATKLNDPFDCHPALINFSNYPKDLESKNGHALALIQAMKYILCFNDECALLVCYI